MSGNAKEHEDASVLSASMSSLLTSHVAPHERLWNPDHQEIQAIIDADAAAWLAAAPVAEVSTPEVATAAIDDDLADMPAPALLATAPFAAAAYTFVDDPAVSEEFDIPAEIVPEAPAPVLPAIPEALMTEYVLEDENDEYIDLEDAESAEAAKSEPEDALPQLPDALTRDYVVEGEDLDEDEESEEPTAEVAVEEGETLPEAHEDLTRDYAVAEEDEEAEKAVEADAAVDPDAPALPEAHEDLTREYDLPEDEVEETEEETIEAEAEILVEEEAEYDGPVLPEVPEELLTSFDGDAGLRPEWNPAEGSSTLPALPPVPEFLSAEYEGSFIEGNQSDSTKPATDEAPSLLSGVPPLVDEEPNPYVPSELDLKESLAKFDPAAAMGLSVVSPSVEDPNSDLPAGPTLRPAPSLTGDSSETVIYSLDESEPADAAAYTASFTAGGAGLIAGLNDLTDITGTEEVANPFMDAEPDLTGFEPSRYFGLQNEYDPFNDALPTDEQGRVLGGDMPAPNAVIPVDDVDVPVVPAKAEGEPRDSRAIMKMLRELASLREA